MKVKAGSLDREGWIDDNPAGASLISRETALRHANPTTVLLMRDPETRQHNGVLLVFNVNPQHFKFEQKALVAVQQGHGGYIVSQNGLTAPRWTITGHFGWQLRVVPIPAYVAQGALGKVLGGGNLIHRIPRLQNDMNDIRFDLASGDFKNVYGQFLVGQEGSVTFNGKQRLDGQQAWYALRDLLTYYFEANLERVKKGKPPYELVWYDSLHSLKWVVVPSALPTLERSVATQGTMPYQLEFIGVYDDTRRSDKGWKALDAWNGVP